MVCFNFISDKSKPGTPQPRKPTRRSAKTNSIELSANINNNNEPSKFAAVATETPPGSDNVCVVCRTDKGYYSYSVTAVLHSV